MSSFNFSDTLMTDEFSLVGTLLQLVLAFAMASILRVVYIRYGTSISNRKAFSVNFFLLAMTITFIISIVKSSLALSLGLVGALSIVRFRSAIKEPEELAYLFITIAIGIGLGASQLALTAIAFILIVVAIIVSSRFRKDNQYSNNANLSLQFNNSEKLPELDAVLAALKPHCNKYIVRRYQKHLDHFDLGVLIEPSSESSIEAIRVEMVKLDEKVDVQFVNPQSLAM